MEINYKVGELESIQQKDPAEFMLVLVYPNIYLNYKGKRISCLVKSTSRKLITHMLRFMC